MANEETIEGNQSIESGQSINMDNDLLGRLCHEALQETYAKARGCSGCVRFFAFRLGVFLPGTCDYISDGRANALIDFMNSNWTKITKDEALFQARVGKLVVAGKKADIGHVVVILPAQSEPRNKWGKGKQSLVCCSMTSSTSPYAAGAISDADKTVFDAWGSEDGVDYWFSPNGPSACAGKDLAR